MTETLRQTLSIHTCVLCSLHIVRIHQATTECAVEDQLDKFNTQFTVYISNLILCLNQLNLKMQSTLKGKMFIIKYISIYKSKMLENLDKPPLMGWHLTCKSFSNVIYVTLFHFLSPFVKEILKDLLNVTKLFAEI